VQNPSTGAVTNFMNYQTTVNNMPFGSKNGGNISNTKAHQIMDLAIQANLHRDLSDKDNWWKRNFFKAIGQLSPKELVPIADSLKGWSASWGTSVDDENPEITYTSTTCGIQKECVTELKFRFGESKDNKVLEWTVNGKGLDDNSPALTMDDLKTAEEAIVKLAKTALSNDTYAAQKELFDAIGKVQPDELYAIGTELSVDYGSISAEDKPLITVRNSDKCGKLNVASIEFDSLAVTSLSNNLRVDKTLDWIDDPAYTATEIRTKEHELVQLAVQAYKNRGLPDSQNTAKSALASIGGHGE
jgi:hypothetical protein